MTIRESLISQYNANILLGIDFPNIIAFDNAEFMITEEKCADSVFNDGHVVRLLKYMTDDEFIYGLDLYGVDIIGGRAFDYADMKLVDIDISTVYKIETWAFHNIERLKIRHTDNLKYIEVEGFSNIGYLCIAALNSVKLSAYGEGEVSFSFIRLIDKLIIPHLKSPCKHFLRHTTVKTLMLPDVEHMDTSSIIDRCTIEKLYLPSLRSCNSSYAPITDTSIKNLYVPKSFTAYLSDLVPSNSIENIFIRGDEGGKNIVRDSFHEGEGWKPWKPWNLKKPSKKPSRKTARKPSGKLLN